MGSVRKLLDFVHEFISALSCLRVLYRGENHVVVVLNLIRLGRDLIDGTCDLLNLREGGVCRDGVTVCEGVECVGVGV